MANFKYKTLDGIKPFDKTNVYFCSLKEDFSCFEEISNYILDAYDCAVWYTNNYNIDRYNDNFYFYLNKMNLVVFPVTTNFLTKDTYLYEKEIKFAIENNIPILPIFQEYGLEENFYLKFGIRYTLNNYYPNSQIISKLSKYLDEVLINKETIKRIRNEFDGTLFVAYRKKDKQHIQELSKYIHSFNYTKDVAICYDDYLFEDEIFNDYVKTRIDRSNLFILIVTPNTLLNDKDALKYQCMYVKNTGKQVLPVELVLTDKDKLYEKYNNTQKCITIDEREKLINVIRQITSKENDKENDHDYYIGLAYLYGIDVEKDKEKAIELITKEANNGNIKARETLASMHRNGIGVDVDYESACYYLEKCYKEDNLELSPQYFEKIKIKLVDLYKLMAMNNLDKFVKLENAKKYCAKTLDILNDINKDELLKYDLVTTYEYLIDIYNEEMNENLKNKYIKKAFKIYRSLYKKSNNIKLKRDYAYYNILSVTLENKSSSKIKKRINKSIEINKEIYYEIGSLNAKIDLAKNYLSLGLITVLEKKYDEGKEIYSKVIDIINEVLEDKEIIEAKKVLSICYNYQSDLYKLEHDYNLEKSYLDKAINIAKEINTKVLTKNSKRYLASLYGKKGDICQKGNNIIEAIEYYQKELDLYLENLNKAETIVTKEDIRRSYQKFLTLYFKINDNVNSKEYGLKALNLSREIFEETKSPLAKINFAYHNYSLAAIYLKEVNYSKLEIYVLKALDLYIESYKKESKNEEIIDGLSKVYELLIKLNENNEDYKKIKKYSSLKIVFIKKLYRLNKTPDNYFNLAESIKYYGKNFDKKILNRVLKMYKKLYNEYPENSTYELAYNELLIEL